VHAAGALGDVLLITQGEEILAELLVVELVRRASLVVRQVAHSGDITLLRLRGKPPQLQVF